MKHFSHLRTAATVISRYTGGQPFGIFLKDFFKGYKKYGSKDRKQITRLCYSYFRLGQLAAGLDPEERILLGYFVCAGGSDEFLEALRPSWNKEAGLSPEQKLIHAGYASSDSSFEREIFPALDRVAGEVDKKAFTVSHFQQPDLFLRVRPGRETTVRNKLAAAGISFESISPQCLALPNASKLDDVLEINREVIIQDYSSQRVGELLPYNGEEAPRQVWDCCAASGGKSLMVHDRFPDAEITVSDVRESILVNLKKRFREAGLTGYEAFTADLEQLPRLSRNFDLIVADVPCTGSGTWGRTPERLSFFSEEEIAVYAGKQRRIAQNACRQLQPGGYFLYITCSVYKDENEDVIKFLLEKTKLTLIRSEMLTGYSKRADSLFAALLQLPF